LQILKDISNSSEIYSGEEIEVREIDLTPERHNFSSFTKASMFVLPHNPKLGKTYYFTDKNSSTKWYPTIIHRNGNLIMGYSENLTCDVPNIAFKIVFVGGYIGWKIESDLSIFKKDNRCH
jgi:hypothetical protein